MTSVHSRQKLDILAEAERSTIIAAMVLATYFSGPLEGRILSLNELEARTGVIYFNLNPVTCKVDGTLDRIREERGYSFDDEIEISPSMPKYTEKITAFHTEHLHAEEEVRFLLNGKTNFDVRDAVDDSWIRIEVTAGDLLILPAGLYHRLTLIGRKPVKMLRLFLWKPIWSCYFRNFAADDLECRKNYLAHCDCSSMHGNHSSAIISQ